MKTIIHPAAERGIADHGWLKARHSFSFSSYYHPEKIQFGALRVLNDDTIAPGMGFGKHPHDNTEIITIPLSGGVKHGDSMGNEGIVKPGEVQIMSAGTGVIHSEHNASSSETLNLFQIWIMPELRNIAPRYDQKQFEVSDRLNKFQTLVSPEKSDSTLWINQQAWLSLGKFDKASSVNYNLHIPNNGVYVMVVSGELEVAGQLLGERDAIGVSDVSVIKLKFLKETEVLMIEIPMI
jgi:redox-sensitive bicupin YhaK (pirin superfamily)